MIAWSQGQICNWRAPPTPEEISKGRVQAQHIPPLTKDQRRDPTLRGWANYFKGGNAPNAFDEIKRWLDLKIRRHLMEAMKRSGCAWKRWSTTGLFAIYNIYSDFKATSWKANPVL
jgi:RNA-directed DNA polymerase